MGMIDNEKRLKALEPSQYMQIFGITSRVFEQMYEELMRAYETLHAKGGKPPTLSV